VIPTRARRIAAGRTALGAALLCAAGAGCAGSTLALSSSENDPAALARALARERRPAPGRPQNATGRPLALVVVTAPRPRLVAWDLAAARPLWSVDAQVTSRVAIGGSISVAREGQALVARRLGDGQVAWRRDLPRGGKLLGLAADGDRAFAVIEEGAGASRAWHALAVGGRGQELWRTTAAGALGAPAARGGLLYLPFFTQWLAILDGDTGAQLARIRPGGGPVSWVRATSENVTYGARGVLALDERSAGGTTKPVALAAGVLPGFARGLYHLDAFNPAQAAYSALDRNRLLWRARAVEGGALELADGLVVAFSYRTFFGLDAASGELRWVHAHAGEDVVAVEDTGRAVVYVAADGEVGALDRKTGAPLSSARLPGEAAGRAAGASFDADGWRAQPAAEASPAPVVPTLATVVADRDARFIGVKVFAVAALGRIPGADAARALLAIAVDDSAPAEVHAAAAQALAERKDPALVPALLALLAVRRDFATDQKPRGVDVAARALAALGAPPAQVGPALLAQLEDPATPPATVVELAHALVAVKARDAAPALASWVLIQRGDPSLGAEALPAAAAVVDAALRLGGPPERAAMAFVAGDPGTVPAVAEAVRAALESAAAAP
jgi:outer membrane protein assembly factor BamB